MQNFSFFESFLLTKGETCEKTSSDQQVSLFMPTDSCTTFQSKSTRKHLNMSQFLKSEGFDLAATAGLTCSASWMLPL